MRTTNEPTMQDAECQVIISAFEPLIRGICFHRDVLKIEDRSENDRFQLGIMPHTADYAVLCGGSGRTLNAFRFLVTCAVRKARLHLPKPAQDVVVLDETFIGDRDPARAFKRNDNFNIVAAEDLFTNVATAVFTTKPSFRMNEIGETLVFSVKAVEPSDATIIGALREAFYPWGIRQGMITKVRPE